MTTAAATPQAARGRVLGSFPSLALLLALALLADVAPAPCYAASAWKNAEDKLREQGLLHGDPSVISDDGPSDAYHSDGDDENDTSPAEGAYREAKKLLSDANIRPRQKTKAFGLLQRAVAADSTHRHALTLLGRAYQMGEGVDADEALAVEYFERAAALGDPGAHEELGFAYSVGWVGRKTGECTPELLLGGSGWFSHCCF